MGGFWPDETQTLLLRAALLEGAAARDAFSAWQTRIDLDTLDGASVRVLPLLCHNLTSGGLAGTGTPLLPRLQGIYRQTWYKNQMLVSVTGALVTRLSQAGIPALVLKGIPLALTAYPHLATRPMSDADILIPPDQAPIAARVLEDAGLTPHPYGAWPPQINAGKAFVHRDGWEVDVHTRVMRTNWAPEAESDMWRAGVPLLLHDVQATAPALEDQLLHVLVHGLPRNPMPPIRWIPDAMMILRNQRTFDWGRFDAQVRRRGLVLIARTALTYLRTEFDAPVPAAVMRSLERHPVGLKERIELRGHLIAGVPGMAAGVFGDYLRARRQSAWRGPLGFVHYVRDHLQLSSSWHVPSTVWRLSVRRARRWLDTRGHAPRQGAAEG
jgi:hypothetical protein